MRGPCVATGAASTSCDDLHRVRVAHRQHATLHRRAVDVERLLARPGAADERHLRRPNPRYAHVDGDVAVVGEARDDDAASRLARGSRACR